MNTNYNSFYCEQPFNYLSIPVADSDKKKIAPIEIEASKHKSFDFSNMKLGLFERDLSLQHRPVICVKPALKSNDIGYIGLESEVKPINFKNFCLKVNFPSKKSFCEEIDNGIISLKIEDIRCKKPIPNPNIENLKKILCTIKNKDIDFFKLSFRMSPEQYSCFSDQEIGKSFDFSYDAFYKDSLFFSIKSRYHLEHQNRHSIHVDFTTFFEVIYMNMFENETPFKSKNMNINILMNELNQAVFHMKCIHNEKQLIHTNFYKKELEDISLKIKQYEYLIQYIQRVVASKLKLQSLISNSFNIFREVEYYSKKYNIYFNDNKICIVSEIITHDKKSQKSPSIDYKICFTQEFDSKS